MELKEEKPLGTSEHISNKTSTDNTDQDFEITPLVANFGIGVPTTDEDLSLKNDYIDYLEKKYK